MKKILVLCLTACLAAAATAQTPAPEKEVLIVDRFLRDRMVPAPYVQVLRNLVLEAFAARGRHRLVDAETLPQTADAPSASSPATPEGVAEELGVLLDTHAPQALASGARYLVCGALADYRFEHVELPSGNSGKSSRPGFRATFRAVLSAVDLARGIRLPDETCTLTATAPVAEDADRAALGRISGQMEYYIDRNFKFETRILDLCPADRKGRLRELWIHSGTSMGVKTGDLFIVYEEVPVGGVMTRRKTGRLRVTDASNPEAARCRIAKGDTEIAAAFAAGRTLICVSDGKAFGF